MARDDSEKRIVSRKELAKEQRRTAYRKLKERQATDPRYLAQKAEAKARAKEQRRAAYQKLKEQRKAAAAVEKTKLRAEQASRRAQERRGSDQELWKLVGFMTKGSDAAN